MAPENSLLFSVVSVVEDVLQQHGTTRAGDLNMESRKAEEDALRRNEAAGWLRKMVGVVAAKDLPAEPSDEEFRLGLHSGIILCNALNKAQPGAVPKVVESPPALIPDGVALSAFQYFENVRNFLVAAQELGLPCFEASDLEQGGKTSRVVNCVLALKSFGEWKQTGGNGAWKFGGNIKTSVPGKLSPFMNSMSKNLSTDLDSSKMSGSGLSMLVRAILLDKKPEEVPTLVESVLNKVVEEFEHRIASQYSLSNAKVASKDATISQGNKFSFKSSSIDKKENMKEINRTECSLESQVSDERSKTQNLKQQKLLDQQQRDIQDLKHTLHVTKAGMQFIQMKFQEECTSLGVHIHSLAHAASGYHKVLEENRKLYNQVQDLKGNIRVYCRVRPFFSGSNYLSAVEQIEDGAISVSIPSKHGKGCKSFNFNKVFGPSATQAEVYSDMQPLVRSVLDGYNVCIFAYGQTGSGKTYTMTGPRDLTEKNLGINYRALSDLFQIAEQRQNIFHYSVAVQMIEIYNEQVRDLLVTDGSNKRLEIRNSSQTGLNVPEANLVPVSSTSDVIDLMNLGHRNRAVGATALNDRSSRSHSCLTVHVQGKDLTSGVVLRGCMHLVDLAGSERVYKSEVAGDRLKEAQHINKSLSALGDVIASLAQKNSHVPYRNSKLTQLLQDSLGGQAKTLMFVHISPEADAIGETISTLKFAERVATVELGVARVNKDSTDVKELKEQIATLKAALARKEGAQDHLHSISGNSGASLFNSSQRHSDVNEKNLFRQPMGDAPNIEVHAKATRQKHKSFDLDDLLANSPPWPPVISPNQKYGQDVKDLGANEWVDKVMVNKQDAAVVRAENSLQGWETDNDFYQKFFSDSSNIYPEKSYNMLMSNGSFYAGSNDDTDELDAATSDSSEPDMLWQHNQSKQTNIESMIRKPTKAVNHPNLSRNLNHTQGPSPSHKNVTGIPVRKARQPILADGKRKTGTRK